ncbi:hypothetical protein ACFY3U_22565 [Micromonospora sp. NPDC000089]|uniref:hypothetical protein n=1 Tax=unclassified Micromonospora TaxID=2617518 RepID=UPI0036AF2779
MRKPPASLLATVTVLVVAALAVLFDVRGAGLVGGGDQGFSVDRAGADLSVVGQAPHPSGTPEHEAVRDHLVRALAASSLNPRVSVDTPVLPMRDQSQLSENPTPHPWARRHVGDRSTRLDGVFPNVSARDVWADDARLARIPTGGQPALLALYVDTTQASVEGTTLGGTRLPGGVNRVSVSGPWRWGLVLAAPSSEVELVLTVRGGPARLLALAQVPELPAIALAEPQPRTVTWGSDATGMAFATGLVQI